MTPVKPVQLGIDTESTFDAAQALTMVQAARLLRGRKGNPHPDVMRRWASPLRGCRVGPLQLLLPVVKVGGVLLTMPAWVEAFGRMRARLGRRQAAKQARPAGRRAAAHRRAEARLDAAGIGEPRRTMDPKAAG